MVMHSEHIVSRVIEIKKRSREGKIYEYGDHCMLEGTKTI
jgi:hypothetical protein